MNDRLAEGLQRQTSMTDYCGEGKLFERIFRQIFKEMLKKEESPDYETKRKILEFCPPVVRHAVCCNPGALGRSSIPSCDAAVFSTSHPLSRAVDLEFNTDDDTMISMESGITLTNGRIIGVKKHFQYDKVNNIPFLTEETETNEINPPDKATSMEKAYKRIIHTSYKDIELNGLVNQYFSAPVR